MGLVKILGVFAFLMFVSTSARAGILLEPYVGYEMDSLSADITGGVGTAKSSLNAPAIGARVGYAMTMFWVAADYSTASGTSKIDSLPAGVTLTEDPTTRTTLGLDAGIKIPFFNFYAGYGFMNDATDKAAAGDIKFSGTGLKLGFGYSGLPIIAINLEYATSTYTKYTSSGTEVTIGSAGSTYSAVSASSIMLSVSAPFRF